MEADVAPPRVVISSWKGKSGKTLAVMALIYALSKKGLKVSVFKVGPDFTDPSYHRSVSGSPSRNLDYFLMGDDVVSRFCKCSLGSDIALIEGDHGLYDSVDGSSELGSTAQVAKLLGAPVVLVVDGERINRTAGALVRGLKLFDPGVNVAGAILTNLVERQVEKLTRAVEAEGLTVVGHILRDDRIREAMAYRHLGLTHAAEFNGTRLTGVLRPEVVSALDVDKLTGIAKEASGALQVPSLGEPPRTATPVKAGVLTGKSFTFYYPETIERLGALGSVAFVDPENDQSLPDVDLLFIGGGFPEIYARELEANKALRSDVKRFVEAGGHVYAECGGLMYLTESLAYDNQEYDMVGAIQGVTTVTGRPMAHGYAVAKVLKDTPIAAAGTTLRGHEFHYSRITLGKEYELALSYEKGTGIVGGRDGICVGNAYAHYMHLHPVTYDFVGAMVDHFLRGTRG
ncbi:MAG: hydrogenobyrinic acid a,c-diamide synthase (glutamine-hydrolyzing) [Nitrososphaerota archaeon]|nr:hydrogenobyrinic acid a,c-diamide synthase (glutamine-hydrolyzing) [Nitrososphaerota archaeon]